MSNFLEITDTDSSRYRDQLNGDRSYFAVIQAPKLPLDASCVETLVIGPGSGGTLSRVTNETGGFRAVAYRADGSIAGDSDYGDEFETEVSEIGATFRYVVKITKRGEWWKRP